MRALLVLVGMVACGEPVPSSALDLDGDGASADVDCDDGDASIGPHVVEACDGVDRDCDGDVDASTRPFPGGRTWAPDRDADGWGDEAEVTWSCQALGWPWIATLGDCDDLDPKRHPDAAEVCNGVDDDCDGQTDDDDPDRVASTGQRWYVDVDRDGWGEQQRFLEACTSPGRAYSDRNGDCAPQDPSRHPEAKEVCNGVDDDCNGWTDGAGPEDLPDDEGLLVYPDGDQDGYGDPERVRRVCDPDEVRNATTVGDDCDDRRTTVFPGAPETCNGFDDDCDGQVDEEVADEHLSDVWPDLDHDGYGDDTLTSVRGCPSIDWANRAGDCDDGLASIRPGLPEICNGVDDDCDGFADDDEPDQVPTGATLYWVDEDDDLWGVQRHACGAVPAEAVPVEALDGLDDCDDGRADIHPGAADPACDGVVADCAEREEIVVVAGELLHRVAVSSPGTRVCLGPGVHQGHFYSQQEGTVVWGAGRDATLLASDPVAPNIRMWARNTTVRDLSIVGDPDPSPPDATPIAVGSGATIARVRIADVEVGGYGDRGGVISATGDATIRDLVVERSAYRPTVTSGYGMVYLGGTDATVTVDRVVFRDIALEGPDAASPGSMVYANGRQLRVADVIVDDVEILGSPRPVEGGVFHLGSFGSAEVRDITVRDVRISSLFAVEGGVFRLNGTDAATFDVRRVDVRGLEIDALSSDGDVVAVAAYVDHAPTVDLTHLVVADVDVSASVAHRGMVSMGPEITPAGTYRLQQATFARIDIATPTDVATLVRAAPGTSTADGLVLADVRGPGPLAGDLPGTPLTDTLLGPGLWVGDTPPGGFGPLTSAPDAGFVAYDPATDPATWDLHLLSTSPAVDLLDGVLPDDADGSPADAGAYGGPDGAW